MSAGLFGAVGVKLDVPDSNGESGMHSGLYRYDPL